MKKKRLTTSKFKASKCTTQNCKKTFLYRFVRFVGIRCLSQKRYSKKKKKPSMRFKNL